MGRNEGHPWKRMTTLGIVLRWDVSKFIEVMGRFIMWLGRRYTVR